MSGRDNPISSLLTITVEASPRNAQASELVSLHDIAVAVLWWEQHALAIQSLLVNQYLDGRKRDGIDVRLVRPVADRE